MKRNLDDLYSAASEFARFAEKARRGVYQRDMPIPERIKRYLRVTGVNANSVGELYDIPEVVHDDIVIDDDGDDPDDADDTRSNINQLLNRSFFRYDENYPARVYMRESLANFANRARFNDTFIRRVDMSRIIIHRSRAVDIGVSRFSIEIRIDEGVSIDLLMLKAAIAEIWRLNLLPGVYRLQLSVPDGATVGATISFEIKQIRGGNYLEIAMKNFVDNLRTIFSSHFLEETSQPYSGYRVDLGSALGDRFTIEFTVSRPAGPHDVGKLDNLFVSEMRKNEKYGCMIYDDRYNCLYVAVFAGITFLCESTRHTANNINAALECMETFGVDPLGLPHVCIEELTTELDLINTRYLFNEYKFNVYIKNVNENDEIYRTYATVGNGNIIIPLALLQNSEKFHVFFMKNEFMLTTTKNMRGYRMCDMCKKVFSKSCKHNCQCLEKFKCMKCHISFSCVDDFSLHTRNCFLKGVGFSRYIIFPVDGTSCRNSVEKHRKYQGEVFYCDMESCIKPDTGEHIPLSIGVFVLSNGTFRIFKDNCIFHFLELIDYYIMRDVNVRCLFHNGTGYDFHAILSYIFDENLPLARKVKCISKSSEKCLSFSYYLQTARNQFTKCGCTFIDTLQFLQMSLSKLVDIARGKDENIHNMFPIFFKYFVEYKKMPDEAAKIILKKNAFPYTWLTDKEKLGCDISDVYSAFTDPDALTNFKDVCTMLKLTKFEEYHDIYLTCDTLQLADLFETARAKFLSTHNVDIVTFFGIPGMTWCCFIDRILAEKTIPRLELISSSNIASLFRGLVRGGISTAVKRFSRTDSTHTLIYLDANSLYPHVMQRKFPYADFHLFTREEIVVAMLDYKTYDDYICSINKDGETGYIFECDLCYPDNIKAQTWDFPFLPFHACISGESFKYPFLDDLLKLCPNIMEKRVKTGFEGLIQGTGDKKNYVITLSMLQWYIKHGISVKYIHNIVCFLQKDFLASYINMNLQLRKASCDEYGKTLYKICGNSLYGKTFENKAKQTEIKVIGSEKDFSRIQTKGQLHNIISVYSKYVICSCKSDNVLLDKPSYIGSVVLDYAKEHMYSFLYDKIIPLFGRSNVTMCYTDTDSFILEITHPPNQGGIKNIITAINEKYIDDPPIDCTNVGVISQTKDFCKNNGKSGYFKSETGLIEIKELVALRSKMYSLLLGNDTHIVRSKGVPRSVQQTLDHSIYVDLVQGKLPPVLNVEYDAIKSSKHKIFSLRLSRVALSVDDRKRIICEDGVNTRPHDI